MIAQRSPEWYAQRLGKATASRIAHIVAKTKSGPSALRVNYAAELIAERLTGTPTPNFVSAPMQWGIDHEAQAKALYADRCGLLVGEAEFLDHPEIMWSGASPDGYVDEDGLVEVKCPNTATHLDALLGAAIPGDHLIQMQWQMACTGRGWCDYVSFDPRLPLRMQLHVRRVQRDVSHIIELETEVSAFLAEIAERVERLGTLYGRQEAEAA
jgi:putative phage-type endonuclease